MDDRPLAPRERDLLLRILEGATFEGAGELRAQVSETRVVGGLDTFLELQVAGSAPISARKAGPIPVRAFVEVRGEPQGEVLVWVKDGYFAGLEHAWFTDDAPTGMPSADQIRIDS